MSRQYTNLVDARQSGSSGRGQEDAPRFRPGNEPEWARIIARVTRERQNAPAAGLSVRHVEVGPEDSGQRIDNFLLRMLKGLPRTRLYRLLRKGEVRVNGGRVKPVYRLCAGDAIRLPPVHGLRSDGGTTVPPRVLKVLEQSILFEDDRLLVLNKPAGLAVHGGSGIAFGVIEALRRLRTDHPFLELVHRLDRETSGCLLIAKRRSTLRRLHELIRAGGLEKRYLALLAGRLPRGAVPVEAPLDPDSRRDGERTVSVVRGGKHARSVFRRRRIIGEYSLAEVSIDTGRTHQIRVHAAHIGHPLAGDSRYGDAVVNEQVRARGLKRMFLHASMVSFRDAVDGQRTFEAPLPDDLGNLLEALAGGRT